MLDAGSFAESVEQVLIGYNEARLMEVWLHKVTDKTFNDFRDGLISAAERENISDRQVGNILTQSHSILNSFIPADVSPV